MNSMLSEIFKQSTAIKQQLLSSSMPELLSSMLDHVQSVYQNDGVFRIYADPMCSPAADHLHEELVVRFKAGRVFGREDRRAICSKNYSETPVKSLLKLLPKFKEESDKDFFVIFVSHATYEVQQLLKLANTLGIKTFIVSCASPDKVKGLADWSILLSEDKLNMLYHIQSLALHVICERLEPEFDNNIHGFEAVIQKSHDLDLKFLSDPSFISSFNSLFSVLSKNSSSVFMAGNGGSACDVNNQISYLNHNHIFCGREFFNLHSSGTLLAAYNDGYKPFARQVEASIKKGDLLIVYSTSGNSENLIEAVFEAKRKSATSIGLLGKDGGKLASICDYSIIVPVEETARIQETHTLISQSLIESLLKVV